MFAAFIILVAVSSVGFLSGAVWFAKQRDPSNLWPAALFIISWVLMFVAAIVVDSLGFLVS